MQIAARTYGRLRPYLLEAQLRLPAVRRDRPSSDITVSLTSFPSRIRTVWLTIESIARQSPAPARIVLVLAEDEFPGRELPDTLRRLDLEVLWVPENSRSYKKLIPARLAYPEATIVTADDDVLYPAGWLHQLSEAHADSPDAILGTRGAAPSLTADGTLDLYSRWPGATKATRHPFLKGDGGILYPTGSLPANALDPKTALECCPTADDVWFWAAALSAGTSVRRITDAYIDMPTVRRAQRVSLRAHNVVGGGNDTQLEAAVHYFGVDLSVLATTTGSR